MEKTEIVILKTNEISDDIWEQIRHGYEVCFDSKESIEGFKQFFSESITGYSIHALKFTKDGKLMGHNYYQPRPYKLQGRDVICAVSGGTFVLPEYRKDMFIFHDLIKALNKYGKEQGWLAQIGVPNENSFTYAIKINKEKHVGDLHYYLLPIHAGKILKKSSFIDSLSGLYSRCIAKLAYYSSFLFNFKEKEALLRINDTEQFLNVRLANPEYRTVQKGDLTATYRLFDEDGIKTAYLIHVSQNGRRSNKALTYAVNEILKREKVDAILYIGTLNVKQFILTKVPKKFVPHQLPVMVSVFDKKDEQLKEVLSSLSNFDFGLLNFDVR